MISWTSVKLNFCSAKDTVKKKKQQTTDLIIFATRISSQGPIFKIYKEQLKLNSKKTNIETESSLVLTRGFWRGNGELLLNGYKIFIWGDEKVLKKISGDSWQHSECI